MPLLAKPLEGTGLIAMRPGACKHSGIGQNGDLTGDFRMKLAGKVALVTGAQQGIGAAIARALAGEGADVAITWLDDQAGAEAVATDIRKAGRRAHLIKADVARLAEIEAMVAETVRTLGTPDILVNNAGVYPRVPLLEMRESDWDHVLDINLKAGCFATIAVAKALIAAGRKGGAVINLSSAAIRGAVRGVHYSASKGGVVSMTRALALELALHGIRVNAIAPGLTDTAQPRYGNTDAELIEMARTNIPLGGRLLTPDQIARTAVFLASEDASATTGQVLHVNGGSYMP
ncbi:MAG: SDR family oxidoreductase [Reyranella sp.]|nr:MAG: SDR family oxidoreductase [Reyranella sp.]